MQRHFALPFFAAVGLAALSPALISRAAEQPPAPGTITTVAGTGQRGFSSATAARPPRPNWPPLRPRRRCRRQHLIADAANNRVRKVSPAGITPPWREPASPASPGTAARPLRRA